jgi:hypothetical protein
MAFRMCSIEEIIEHFTPTSPTVGVAHVGVVLQRKTALLQHRNTNRIKGLQLYATNVALKFSIKFKSRLA